MRDYSKYPVTPVMFSGAERKIEILIQGEKYIVKFQKNSEVGLTYSHVSEYLGSHIFQAIGIPVQETFLGTYQGKNVVVMKNFLKKNDCFVPFNGVGESSLERDKELYQYTYEDITAMLQENMKSTDVPEKLERFWDMFIVDALIGKTCVVKTAINNIKSAGAVTLNGIEWSARSFDDSPIEEGTVVKVVKIEGVKLIVENI